MSNKRIYSLRLSGSEGCIEKETDSCWAAGGGSAKEIESEVDNVLSVQLLQMPRCLNQYNWQEKM